MTGAGFITLAATLMVVPSIPVAGMALILGIDRFMSECRALTNLVGNACACIVVARWEKELDTEKLAHAFSDKNATFDPELTEGDSIININKSNDIQPIDLVNNKPHLLP